MDYLRNNLSIVLVLIGVVAEILLFRKLQQLSDKLKKLRSSGRVADIIRIKGAQRLFILVMVMVPPLIYFLITTINKIQ